MKIKSICCIGAGYVGGPTMAVIALKCKHLKVTVVDVDSNRIDSWNDANLDNLPVYEPGLAEVVKETRGRNLFFSTDIDEAISESEMIFVAVNTPTKTYGEGKGEAADLKFVELCARKIAEVATSDKIVVEKSTLPVRTAESIQKILDTSKSSVHFEVLSNPEFLAEGTAIQDLFKSDRVLIGGQQTESGKNAISSLVDIYSNWIPIDKIYTTNVWSSELSKLVSNAFLAQRISSINSISSICEVTGADINEVSTAVGMDSRIGNKFLKSSVGFGGSCFQKDILNLCYIAKSLDLHEVAEYWRQVIKINDYQKYRFAKKIISSLFSTVSDKKITLLGWAFKKDTNDSRESASIYVTQKIYEAGANIDIYDPQVPKENILHDINIKWGYTLDEVKKRIYIKKESLSTDKYDAYVILTEYEDFKTLEVDPNKVFDGRNIFDNALYSIGKSQ